MECSECEFSPTQDPKYYCFDPDCQALLCRTCLKGHPKEHDSTITTIENVKLQTFRKFQEETQKQLQTYFENMLKSTKMNNFFKEAFGTLMRQNTTVNFDQEDVADVLADNLKRRCFPEGAKIEELPEKNLGMEFSKQDLISFDYEYDAYSVDDGDDHQETAEKLCNGRSEFYDSEPLEAFYVKSNPQIIFWNTKSENLLCKVLGRGGRSVWYDFPKCLNSLTILNSTKLLFLGASDEKLILYSAEEVGGENYGVLKICEEFQHERIAFLASDNINCIFVVTAALQANIYMLKIEGEKLELCSFASFQVLDIPKKVVFDRANNLLFIAYDHLLEIYKHNLLKIPRLIQKFADQTIDFSWHQKTKRLLVSSSNELYQFEKGKFRLVRTIDKGINCRELTRNGIVGIIEGKGLYFFPQKNPEKKILLKLPRCESIMDELQEISFERFYYYGYHSDVDANIGRYTANYEQIKLLAESIDNLLIFVQISYSQSASQRIDYDRNKEFGGSLNTQRLIKYDLTKNIEIEESDD